jgi:hypothetical protein
MKHDLIDQRSRAMGQIIARRLRANPKLIDIAMGNLDRWLTTCAPNSYSTLMEWKSVLASGLDATTKVLCGEDERSVRLRQSSPFAGEEFITRAERTDLIVQYSGNHPA